MVNKMMMFYFRTGEKMALSDAPSTDDDYCSMCHAPLDTQTEQCSAMAAIAFSQSLSANKQEADTQTAAVSTDPNTTAGGNACCNSNPSVTNASCSNEKTTECCGEGDGSCKTSSQKTK